MLLTHKRYVPAFAIEDHPEQYPLCVYTILSVNERVRDCSAYEAISHQNASEALIAKMKGGGNKIREDAARKLFPEIEEMGLRYRR